MSSEYIVASGELHELFNSDLCLKSGNLLDE